MRFSGRYLALLLSTCAFLTPAYGTPSPAHSLPTLRDDAARPGHPGEQPLDAASAPLTFEPEAWVQVGDAYIVHNVAKPTLTPFLPDAGTANGTAVIIAPGGGFMMLSMSSEGYDVARWLASKGVAAFVLKYRLTATPRTATGTMALMSSRLSAKEPLKAQWFADGTRIAAEDATAAIRLVRTNAAKWNVDPNKVGFLGFSAGAFTALALVDRANPGAMPDFVAPIYGSFQTPSAPLPSKLPPMWASIAADDPLFAATDFGLIKAWRANGGTVEFHLYDKGGHGYGFAGTPGTTTVNWPGDFLSWLESRGLYDPEARQPK